VEFIVAIVSALVLAAAMLQLTSVMLAHNRVTTAARRQAGIRAMQAIPPISSPALIRDWDPSADGHAYTSDDTSIPSAAGGQFAVAIVERAASSASGWSQISQSRSDQVTPLRGNLAPCPLFGLVDGHDREYVPVISAVQSLLYGVTQIEVDSRVWMTVSGGFYE
jgi:hypothetical protein